MNKKLLLKFNLKSIPLLIVIAVIASFPFLGTQCSQFINGEGINPADFVGEWELKKQSGSLIDICPDERVKFGTDFHVGLTCPPFTDTLWREYTTDDVQKILTYKPTQIMYRYEFVDSASDRYLYLYGLNVNRNLFYLRISQKSKSDISFVKNKIFLNSSEVFKK